MSLSCASVFVFPQIPPSKVSSLSQIWDWGPSSSGEIKAGESPASPIAPGVTAAGCAAELLTYRCANAVLANVIIQEQLEKRHEISQLWLFQLFSQAFSSRYDSEGGDPNYNRRQALLTPLHGVWRGDGEPSAPLTPCPIWCQIQL